MNGKEAANDSFSWKSRCSRCEKEYQWEIAAPDKIDRLITWIGKPCTNVKNWERINRTNRFVIELECSFCFKKDHVEVEKQIMDAGN